MDKIVISTTTFGQYDNSPLELCEKKKFAVTLNPYRRKINPNELIELAKDAVGLISGTEAITEETLSKLSELKVISRCGVGLDNIDLNAAEKFGIKIYNTPNSPALAVAELTIGLILNLLRKINEMDKAVRMGHWDKRMGSLLSGRNIGIIGFGRIGRKVAELLKAFNCKAAYFDPFIKTSLCGYTYLTISSLIKWADIITIHVSTKDKIFGKKEISLMKKGAFLVNTSRGGVIDEDVLYMALKNKHLAGAALDVFKMEPYHGPLEELDNIILTPHIGSYAKEARVKMEKEAVENLLTGLGKFRKCKKI